MDIYFVLTSTNDLRLCKTWGQTKPILEKLRAGIGATELAHKSILLKEANDPIQQNHGDEFMEKAIEDIEHNLREELLPDTNTGSRNRGSSGATDFSNFPQVGTMSKNGERSMMGMQDTMNQWKNNMAKSLGNYIQKNMVEPRDRKIREKNKQIENQQREIQYLKRINEQILPRRIDMPPNLGIVREAELPPRQTNIIMSGGGFDSIKPVLDMTPTSRKGQTVEQVRYDILAEDRALSNDSFND